MCGGVCVKIAEVSKMFELTSDTLRYYEKEGLIGPVKRTKSGVREYSEEDLQRIHFVKCMRHAGLSIESIHTYIELNNQGDATLINRREILLSEKEKIEATIRSLQDTLDYLNGKIERYNKHIEKIKK